MLPSPRKTEPQISASTLGSETISNGILDQRRRGTTVSSTDSKTLNLEVRLQATWPPPQNAALQPAALQEGSRRGQVSPLLHTVRSESEAKQVTGLLHIYWIRLLNVLGQQPTWGNVACFQSIQMLLSKYTLRWDGS